MLDSVIASSFQIQYDLSFTMNLISFYGEHLTRILQNDCYHVLNHVARITFRGEEPF
jgi:hypothetical protein